MQQPDQQSAGPAQPALFAYQEFLGKNDQLAARHLAECDPRSVFENEAELEHTIMHDREALEVLGKVLGISIDSVANQVRTHEGLMHRADIVTIPSGRSRPGAVMELMLHELDRDHLHRGLLYAVTLGAGDLVLIAHTFPPRSRIQVKVLHEWLEENEVPLRVHLVALQTDQCASTGHGYYRLTPVTPPRPAPRRSHAFLEALSRKVADLGDASLADVAIVDGRRMDSYQALGEHTRIRIYAGIDTTRITVMVSSSRLRRRLLRKHLSENLSVTLAPLGLIEWTQQSGRTTVATYTFATPHVTPEHPVNGQVTRLAHAYAIIRSSLMRAVGDFSRAKRPHGSRVHYLPRIGEPERVPNLGAACAATPAPIRKLPS